MTNDQTGPAPKWAVVETSSEPGIQPHQDAVAEALIALGWSVARWDRRRPLPKAEAVFWWGNNVSAKAQRTARTNNTRIFYIEYGWTFDRAECLQIDERGPGGLASWAERPLAFEPRGPLAVRPSGDLLVCLRYEGHFPVADSAWLSPYFADNLAWVAHLAEASALPLRLRPHHASWQGHTVRLKDFCNRMDGRIAWDTSPDFRSAAGPARAVAVIDSTAGVQAMELGLPVLCFGRQIFRHERAAYCLTSDPASTRRAAAELADGRCSLDSGAVAAVVARAGAKQWYLRDSGTFPARLHEEFGL